MCVFIYTEVYKLTSTNDPITFLSFFQEIDFMQVNKINYVMFKLIFMVFITLPSFIKAKNLF